MSKRWDCVRNRKGKNIGMGYIIFSLSVEIEEEDFSSETGVNAILLPFNIRSVLNGERY